MANNNKAIRILRGTRTAIANSSETLEKGQLLYNVTDNYLTCGDNDGTGGASKKSVKGLPIVCRELNGYTSDERGIASSTGSSKQYYIKNSASVNASPNLKIHSDGSVEIDAAGTTIKSPTGGVTVGTSSSDTNAVVNGTLTTKKKLIVSNSTNNSGAEIHGDTSITGTLSVSDDIATDDIKPSENNSKNIGTSSLKYKDVYATTFHGALTGNVTGNLSGNITGNRSISGTFTTRDIVPNTNIAYNIGTSANKFNSVHAIELYGMANTTSLSIVDGTEFDDETVFNSQSTYRITFRFGYRDGESASNQFIYVSKVVYVPNIPTIPQSALKDNHAHNRVLIDSFSFHDVSDREIVYYFYLLNKENGTSTTNEWSFEIEYYDGIEMEVESNISATINSSGIITKPGIIPYTESSTTHLEAYYTQIT